MIRKSVGGATRPRRRGLRARSDRRNRSRLVPTPRADSTPASVARIPRRPRGRGRGRGRGCGISSRRRRDAHGRGRRGATGDFGDESPRDPGLSASPTPRALSGEKRPVVPGVPGASARTPAAAIRCLTLCDGVSATEAKDVGVNLALSSLGGERSLAGDLGEDVMARMDLRDTAPNRARRSRSIRRQ